VTSEESSATRRYKEIMAQVTAAAGEVRRADGRRAEELRHALIGLQDEMVRAGERARLTASVVQLHWEGALDLLWAESWMNLRLRPEPNRNAYPHRLDDYDAEVRSRSDELREAVRRRWYSLRRG
jgi:hypothetical protein